METLPDPVLINIFKLLEYKDRRRCAKVCRRYRALLDYNFGKIVYLGKGNPDMWKENVKHFENIQTITTIGISDCTISGEIDEEEIDEEEIPKFKYPRLVNSIKFDSLLSAGKFNQLVTDLINLQKLVIHNEFLTGVDLDTIFLTFPKMRTFELKHLRASDDQVPMTWNPVQNIVHILDRATFPQVEHLSLSVPWWRDIEEFLVPKIFSFVLRHKNNLKTLQIAFFFMIECRRPIDENPMTMEPLPSITPSDLREIKLDKLYIFSNYCAMSIVDDYFTELSSDQRCLTYFNDLECSSAFSFPILRVQNNAKTLVTINISFHSDQCRLIDCSLAFADCTSLKHLGLCNFNTAEDFEGGWIKRLNALPKSLESIQIYALRSEEALTPLTFEFPNLKMLLLRRTFDNHGNGLPANAILEILRRKTVKQIYIDYPSELTKDFLVNLRDSSESYPFVTKILIDVTKYRIAHFHLENQKYKRGYPNKEIIFGRMDADDFPPTDFFKIYPPPPESRAQVIVFWDKFITAVTDVEQRVLLFLWFWTSRHV